MSDYYKMRIKNLLIILAASGCIGALTPEICAQESAANDNVIYVSPLFEYPVAPDSIESLTGKSEYLVTHFWDGMNFKKKQTVDQNALNHAFQVFVSPMRWADQSVTDKAVTKLLKQLSSNPALHLQFTKAAEENLFGPRAIYWADQIYLRFIDNLLANKKVPKTRKQRYQWQKELIENSLVGHTAKSFEYTTPTGNKSLYRPDGVITLIEFGDPECDECRMAKLRMETDVTFTDLVDRGLVNVMFIIPDPEEGWQTSMTGFSPKWHVGASDTVLDIYDLRLSPSIYVIGREGKILAKNVPYRQAMQLAASEALNSDNREEASSDNDSSSNGKKNKNKSR